MESLDIQYYDETFELSKNYVNALLKTAEVLLRYGKTGNFHGLCLSADEQKREILFSNVNYRY